MLHQKREGDDIKDLNVTITATAQNAPYPYIVAVQVTETLTRKDNLKSFYYLGSVTRTVVAPSAPPEGVTLTSTVTDGEPLTVQTGLAGEPTVTLVVPDAGIEVLRNGKDVLLTTPGPETTSTASDPAAQSTASDSSSIANPTGNPPSVSTAPPTIPSPPKTTGGNSTDTTETPSAGPIQAPQSNAGAVAGAAIGCLIAGLLLGFLIAFLWYKKRSQQQQHHYAPPPTVVESKAFDTPPPPPIVDDKLSRFLLDATPDKDIVAELRSLGTLIQQHVENNYHLNPVQADPRALAVSLTQLGLTNDGNGLSPEVVAQLALDPRTRQVALQHVISQVLFTSIDVNSRSRLSMLPVPIAAFLQSIPPTQNGEMNNEVFSTALNQWRSLSAFILHPSRSQRTPLPTSNAAVAPQASGLADALDTFVGYFVDENNRFQQKSHLQAVITEFTKFGYILLSQPHEWSLVNNPGPVHHSGPHGYSAVVCAGLVKVTLRDGTPVSAPQQVVPPLTVVV